MRVAAVLVTVLVTVLVAATACSHHKPAGSAAATVRVEVTAGKAVVASDPARHVTLAAAADVLPPGTLTLGPAGPAVVAGAGVHDAVSITAGTDAPVLGDLQLRYTVPGNAPPDALVAYLDERRHQWIPVPTERSGNELVATVGHLTDFAWFDDLRATVGAFFGVRAAAPKCEPARPDWVQGLYTTDGADAQILACVETAGGDVKMKIVNNRAYPVALQLSATPKSIAVDFGWPASIRDVLDRMASTVVGTGPALTLPPLGTVEVVYARPADPQVVTGFARVGLPSALLTILITALLDSGAVEFDVPVGGKSLGLPTVDCLLGAVSGIRDLTSLDRDVIAGAVQKFAGCALLIVTAERAALILNNDGNGRIVVEAASLRRFEALSKARDLLTRYNRIKAAVQLAEQVVEAALDLRPSIRDNVDVTLDLKGQDLAVLTPTTVAGVKVGGSGTGAETALRKVLGAPTGTRTVPGCPLGTPAGDSRRLLSWGGLTLVTGSSGASKGKLVGWTVTSAEPLSPLVRLPYKVTTATSVRDAKRQIPGATAEWDDVFGMYAITTTQAPAMLWTGDHEDGSGEVTFITNAFEPCE